MMYVICDFEDAKKTVFYYSQMDLCGFDGKIYLPLTSKKITNMVFPFLHEVFIGWKLAPAVHPHRKWAVGIVPRDEEDRVGHVYLVLGMSTEAQPPVYIKRYDAQLRLVQRWVRRKMAPYVTRSRQCRTLALTYLARSTVLNHDCVRHVSTFCMLHKRLLG